MIKSKSTNIICSAHEPTIWAELLVGGSKLVHVGSVGAVPLTPGGPTPVMAYSDSRGAAVGWDLTPGY